MLDALSTRMEALDPARRRLASTLAVSRVRHAHGAAPLDVGRLVWREVAGARPSGCSLDIDALARAYGWTEADVLALTPMRRAAYLQMLELTADDGFPRATLAARTARRRAPCAVLPSPFEATRRACARVA